MKFTVPPVDTEIVVASGLRIAVPLREIHVVHDDVGASSCVYQIVFGDAGSAAAAL